MEQNNYWSGKIKSCHLDGSAIYPSLHNQYIPYVYPKYCDLKVEIFHEELCFKKGKLFSFNFYGL